MNKLILFDFDGVIANTLDDILQNASKACQILGYECTPSREDVDELTKMEFLDLGKQLKVPDDKLKLFVNLILELFTNQESELKIFPNMEKVIAELSKDKNKIVIITGNNSITVEKVLARYSIMNYINLILDINQPGSKFEKILTAIDIFNFPISDVYMIGDAMSDIQAAKKAKIKSIAVAWGNQSLTKLKQTQPDFIANFPLDLIKIINYASK